MAGYDTIFHDAVATYNVLGNISNNSPKYLKIASVFVGKFKNFIQQAAAANNDEATLFFQENREIILQFREKTMELLQNPEFSSILQHIFNGHVDGEHSLQSFDKLISEKTKLSPSSSDDSSSSSEELDSSHDSFPTNEEFQFFYKAANNNLGLRSDSNYLTRMQESIELINAGKGDILFTFTAGGGQGHTLSSLEANPNNFLNDLMLEIITNDENNNSLYFFMDCIDKTLKSAEETEEDKEKMKKMFSKLINKYVHTDKPTKVVSNKFTNLFGIIPSLNLGDGDFVTDIKKLSNGSYQVNGINFYGEHRFIQIDLEGNVQGYNGADLGYVGKKFEQNLEKISRHFKVAIPLKVKGNLQWSVGDGTVTNIVRFTNVPMFPNGSYRINGKNDKNGKHRYIDINIDNGKITGHNGDNLGVIENQIKAQLSEIAKNFDIPIIQLGSDEWNLGGGNSITSIVKLLDGSFRVNGHNSKKEYRYINIATNGEITGHEGHNLGYVEQRMRNSFLEISHEIYERFGIKINIKNSTHGSSSSSSSPTPR